MQEIDNLLHKQIVEGKTPSVQYWLFNSRQVIKTYSDGLAHLQKQEPVSGQHTYHVFSVTKTITAIAILQLQQKGKLNIDDPVVNYLPFFPYSGAITIRHLLAHTAGLANPLPISWVHLVNDHPNFNRDAFFDKVYSKNLSLKSKPGQKFAYSNLGYILLGQLMEKITGLRYEEYVWQNIIQPLGLTQQQMAFVIPNLAKHVTGYQKLYSLLNLLLSLFINKDKMMGNAEGSWRPFKYFYVNGTAYGGLISTPVAMVRYLQDLLAPDSLLLDRKHRALMFAENFTEGNRPTGMCLSWYTGKLQGETYYTHAGGGGGYYCEVRLYTGRGMGSAIFFNRSGITDERFLDDIDVHWLKDGKIKG